MSEVHLTLTPEEAFYSYHTVCTYLVGDRYRGFRYEAAATDEDVRRVASKIETGADGVWLSATEAEALADAYCAACRDTPLDYPDVRELATKIYDAVPDEGGELNYGPNWQQKRERVLERDDYECQKCSLDNEAHRQRRGRGLHVHHIVPLRKFDDVEEANQPDNLVTLCASCHSELEGNTLEEADLA